jgi:hypothetical protein
VAGVREETDGGHTLCVAGPGVDARLGDKGLLGAGLGGEMRCVRKGGMHVGPALVVGRGLAVEDGGLLAGAAALGVRLFADDDGLGGLVLVRLLAGVVLFDAVEEGGLVLAVPGSPGADVGAVAVDDVEGALVLALALEVALLGVCGAHGVDGCAAVLEGGVEGAEDCGCGGVDGGVGGVAEDGVCEMLCVEGMVGHGLLLDVAGECVLDEEAVPISKGVVGAVDGQDQVVVGDVDVDLGVGGPGEEGGGRAHVLEDMRRGISGERAWRGEARFLGCGEGKDVAAVVGHDGEWQAGYVSNDLLAAYMGCEESSPPIPHDGTRRRSSLVRPRRRAPRRRRRCARAGRQLEGRRGIGAGQDEQGLQEGKRPSLHAADLSPVTAVAALPIAERQEIRLVQARRQSPFGALSDPFREMGRHRQEHPRPYRRRVLKALSRGPRSLPQEGRLVPRRGRQARRRLCPSRRQMGPRRPGAPAQRPRLP